MSRELKFRVWDGESIEMVEGDVGIDINGIAYVDNPLTDDFTYYPDCPIMQYTGIKDKNGVEIYEGDILSDEHSLADTKVEVYWRQESAAWWVRSGNVDTNAYNFKWCEVIGNIYENPELAATRSDTPEKEVEV